MLDFEYGGLKGATGASHTSWQSGPRLVLADVMDEAKDVFNEKAVWEAFITAVLPSTARNGFPEDEDWLSLNIVYSYFFKNNYSERIRHYKKPKDETAEEKEAKAAAAAQAADEKAAAKAKLHKLLRDEIDKRALSLMEQVMSNGKKLGDFTREDALTVGRYTPRWLARIAAKMGPGDILRDKATEEDLREMLAEAQLEG